MTSAVRATPLEGIWAGDDGRLYSTRGRGRAILLTLKERADGTLYVKSRRTENKARSVIDLVARAFYPAQDVPGHRYVPANGDWHDTRPANLVLRAYPVRRRFVDWPGVVPELYGVDVEGRAWSYRGSFDGKPMSVSTHGRQRKVHLASLDGQRRWHRVCDLMVASLTFDRWQWLGEERYCLFGPGAVTHLDGNPLNDRLDNLVVPSDAPRHPDYVHALEAHWAKERRQSPQAHHTAYLKPNGTP